MDRFVAGSPPPATPTDREASADVEPIETESVDERSEIQRQITALNAFLARYPLPNPPEPPITTPEQAITTPEEPIATSEQPITTPEQPITTPEQPISEEESVPIPEYVSLLNRWKRQILVGVALAAIIAVFAFAGLPFRSSASAEAATGKLSVTTDPSGLSVVVDGKRRGVTPLTVDLAAGDHVMELAIGSDRRRISVKITKGAQVSHFLEFAPLALAFPSTPAAAPTPVVATAGSPDSNAAGWISVATPAEVEVSENGRLLGSSLVDRIMLPVGRHQLEFKNERLGFRTVQTVQVVAGEVAPIQLRWPQGSVALNAIPWAEVWIDGRAVGETPLGNVSLPIGVHEVIFRHPELGERRASITVSVGKPTTLGMDFGAK